MTVWKMSPKRREEARQLLDLLVDRWPQCFDLKPLKIGIRDDLAAALGEAADNRTLGNALSLYTSRADYRDKLAEGASRYDLDGQPCGVVSAEQARKAHLPRTGPLSLPLEAPAELTSVEGAPPAPQSVPTIKRSSLADLKTAARARAAQAV